jgi:hypothetical protein
VLRRIRQLALLMTLGAAACSAQLPSETPLGLGPLAKRPRAPEPSGAPVSLPGSGPQMQFEDDEEDSTGENEQPPSSTDGDGDKGKDAADAGMAKADSAPTPAAGAPASNAPTAALDFTGEYSGKDVITIRASGRELPPQEDPNAKMSVKKSGDTVSLTIVASNTGDPICTVKGEQKGDTVTVTPGQECPPEAQFAGKLKRGLALLQDKRLTLDMSFEISGNVEGKQVTVVTDYHFEGTRR